MGPALHFLVYEDLLIDWILEMQRRRLPISAIELLSSIRKIVQVKKIDMKLPGSKWLKLFLRRHNISVRTSQTIGKNRLVTVKQIEGWFEEVDKYFSDNNFSEILQDPRRVQCG